MRETVHQQGRLVPAIIKHPHGDELKRVSEVLDQLPQAAELVHADLVHPKTKRLGRKGMAAEQVLRAMLIKQMNRFSYEELAFHLSDSSSYRWFCRIGISERGPKKSSLQKAIKRVQASTWERVNQMLVRYAAKKKIENGEKIRTDCTAVESNIHHPNDSSLLWDCVRVLTRLMARAREHFGLSFNDHSRRAKRRAQGIAHRKSNRERLPLYRDLIKVTERTLRRARVVAAELEKVTAGELVRMLEAYALATELQHYAGLTAGVISQAERRVLRGESVHASEKVVSIFEPHTDIVVKDNRLPIYGHKVCLTAGASGLVTDVIVEQGNPADVTLAVKMVERQLVTREALEPRRRVERELLAVDPAPRERRVERQRIREMAPFLLRNAQEHRARPSVVLRQPGVPLGSLGERERGFRVLGHEEPSDAVFTEHRFEPFRCNTPPNELM